MSKGRQGHAPPSFFLHLPPLYPQYTEKDDEDAKVGQRDLDKASGADAVLKDKQSLKFLEVIGAEPDQILR